MVLNVVVFFICFTMKKLDLGLGMALGLFAIFGVLRYRTDAIRTKEMTYLFVVIGLAVINALSNKKTSYVELLAVNFAIFGAVMLKEMYLSRTLPSRQGGQGGEKIEAGKADGRLRQSGIAEPRPAARFARRSAPTDGNRGRTRRNRRVSTCETGRRS